MRQSSNHKVPTIPPESVWAEGIHIDYGDGYPNPTFNKHTGQSEVHNSSPRAVPLQANDYAFEGRFLEQDRDNSDRFEFINFEESNFDASGLTDDDSEEDEFDESANELDFRLDNRHATCDHDFIDDDYESFADELTQSLFPEFDESSKTPGRRENTRARKGHEIQRRVKQQMEQRLAKIVRAANSTDYFSKLTKILDGAVSSLAAARLPSLLQTHLQMVRSLISRYANRGLEESAVLEDVIDIYFQENALEENTKGWENQRPENPSLLSPLLVGLATRIVLKPRLSTEDVSPAIAKKLSGAITQSIQRLATTKQLKALPGLSASVGHIFLRDRHPISQLPQQFYRAAVKVTKSPQLYQRLCSFRLPQPAVPPTGQPTGKGADMPQRLRLNGPVEIFIRHLGEN